MKKGEAVDLPPPSCIYALRRVLQLPVPFGAAVPGRDLLLTIISLLPSALRSGGTERDLLLSTRPRRSVSAIVEPRRRVVGISASSIPIYRALMELARDRLLRPDPSRHVAEGNRR